MSDNSPVLAFETEPICFPPTDLRWTTITAFSISISWDTEGESSWQVQYGPAGFPLGSGTTSNTTSRPFEAEGLQPDTTYEFYVRANCGSDGFSEWSDSLVVTTLAP